MDTANRAQQRIGEISPKDGTDLRHFARFAEPVEPRRKRLLQRRRDRLPTAADVPFGSEGGQSLSAVRRGGFCSSAARPAACAR